MPLRLLALGPDEPFMQRLPITQWLCLCPAICSNCLPGYRSLAAGVDNGRRLRRSGNCPPYLGLPYFNSGLDASNDILSQVNAVSMGSRKLAPSALYALHRYRGSLSASSSARQRWYWEMPCPNQWNPATPSTSRTWLISITHGTLVTCMAIHPPPAA